MTLKNSFCSSPWFHMRINNSGSYEPCRWMTLDGHSRANADHNIRNMTPVTYFREHMSELRTQLLQGETPSICRDCSKMEQHGKVSGRQRQLLKVGVRPEYFEKSLASSPYRPDFDHSDQNQGRTDRQVRDWQIDLGNYCNGACVYCHPESSSTLATEFKALGLIDAMPARAWSDNPALVERFVADLAATEDLAYLHFIGGETVITPGFRRILQALVDAGIAPRVTIGFTTNLTVWAEPVVDLLCQFQMVNLGMSIESLTAVNDYVRYPSQIDQVRATMDRWVALGQQQGWLMQIRITPTCLTVHDLSTVYEYAWHNNLAVESCNFLDRPEFLRISVLPDVYREQARDSLAEWLALHPEPQVAQVINTRDPNQVRAQIRQDAESYLDYLYHAPDETDRLPDLITYLQRLEGSRDNCILDYLPQYEDLFESAGY
jgi:sulfatase maturation enzyme AslB (radical SAM superfamily)